MTEHTDPSINQIFAKLARRRNRDLLTILLTEDRPLSIDALASRLVDRESETPSRDPSDDAHREVRAALHHALLPELEDCGLVELTQDQGGVTIGPGSALEEERVRDAIRMQDRVSSRLVDGGSLDAQFRALSHPRRRAVLSILDRGTGSFSSIDLARRLAATTGGGKRVGGSSDEIDELHVSLHHVHLPHLDAAGLVDYDHASNTVSAGGNSALRDELAESVSMPKYADEGHRPRWHSLHSQ